MFFWFTDKTTARSVRNGRRETALCCDCGRKTTFAEVEVTDELTIFSVLKFDQEHSTAFRCTACGALGQLVDTDKLPAGKLENLDPEVRSQLADEREAKRKQERARAAKRAAARDAKAERELAELKRRMGLGPERQLDAPDAPTDDVSPETPSWWSRLRRGRR